jgi:thymidylate synthase ThyX
MIHSEFMTHRVFSRNASSSRAIPVEKTLEMLRTLPAMPIHWGENQKGMQAEREVTDALREQAEQLWMKAASNAAEVTEEMLKLKLHKQVVNRILEPFTFISVVVTATDYQNFFHLRSHPDAQPEIRYLSDLMRDLYCSNSPKELRSGDYHLPYIREEERENLRTITLAKMSAARCARVSYLTHDKKEPSMENDLELFTRLVGGEPIHASPTEHQARAKASWANNTRNGNFHSKWSQFRKFVETMSTDEF